MDEFTKDDIAAWRGGYPSACDWCGKECTPQELEPEEAGQWVCMPCWSKENECGKEVCKDDKLVGACILPPGHVGECGNIVFLRRRSS